MTSSIILGVIFAVIFLVLGIVSFVYLVKGRD
jgi:hypothetical protein